MEVVELDQWMHSSTSTDEIGTAGVQKGARLLTNMQAAHVVFTQQNSAVQYLRRFGCNRMIVLGLISWEMRTYSLPG